MGYLSNLFGAYGTLFYIILIITCIALFTLLIYLIISKKKLKSEFNEILMDKSSVYKKRLILLKEKQKGLRTRDLIRFFNEIFRDYFRETIGIDGELTFEELAELLGKKRKKKLAEFVLKISALPYSPEKIEKEKILDLIDEFLYILEEGRRERIKEEKEKIDLKSRLKEKFRSMQKITEIPQTKETLSQVEELKQISEPEQEAVKELPRISSELFLKARFAAKLALLEGYNKEQVKQSMIKRGWHPLICDRVLRDI